MPLSRITAQHSALSSLTSHLSDHSISTLLQKKKRLRAEAEREGTTSSSSHARKGGGGQNRTVGNPDCWLVQQTGSGLNRVSELESRRVSGTSSVQTLLTNQTLRLDFFDGAGHKFYHSPHLENYASFLSYNKEKENYYAPGKEDSGLEFSLVRGLGLRVRYCGWWLLERKREVASAGCNCSALRRGLGTAGSRALIPNR
ncbi:hypothetical protein Cgig2_025358 [Carnegiea gigantea]|uniref:Uncharacterized protein n=1 Tax=Carnegiea gigantea TaxID=171969 RepID=A0A9Q1GUS3_9CARY|nr:hypothetical protein Cgig2_025358 [Carnegiea gigantea]